MEEARMFLFSLSSMSEVLKITQSKIEAISGLQFTFAFRSKDGDDTDVYDFDAEREHIIDVVVHEGGPLAAYLIVEYVKLWNRMTNTVQPLCVGPDRGSDPGIQDSNNRVYAS